MKKQFVTALCMLLVLSMVLSGCFGGGETPVPTEESSVPSADPSEETGFPDEGPTEDTRVYGDSLLSELKMDEKIEGDEIPVTYRLPQILDDSPAARAFNEEMEAYLTSFEAGQWEGFGEITWEHFWNGNLVSIVLERRYYLSSFSDFQTVTYDFAESRMIDNQMLLSYLAIPTADAQWMLRHAVEEVLDRCSAEEKAAYGAPGRLAMARAMTLSDRNLDPLNVPLFLGENNSLWAVPMITSPLDAGRYPRKLYLEPLLLDDPDKTAEGSNVRAVLDGNRLTVVFENPDEVGETLFGSHIESGETYLVGGLYDVYRDMQIAPLGPDGDQYLCLLDDQGGITVCNLTDGAFLGGSFCGMKLLSLETPIAQMERTEHADGSGCDLCFVTEDGERIDPFEAVSEMLQKAEDGPWESYWTMENSDGTFAVSIDRNADGSLQFSWGGGGGMIAGGQMRYDGMDGSGLRFRILADPTLGAEGGYVISFDRPFYAENPDDCHLHLFQASGESAGPLKQENPTVFFETPY